MNLLVKKFVPLAVILLGTFLAISCEDPGKIGLLVNAENGVITTHYQDIVLPTTVVQFNPRKTSESTSLQAGKYFNPDFGLVTSKSYTQLSLSIVVEPNTLAAYKSFEMSISFNSFIGTSPIANEKQVISVYQLAEDLEPTRNYTRLDEVILAPNPLGIWDFAPNKNDTLQNDSVFVVPLDDLIGRDLFSKLRAGDPIFDSNEAFNDYFKGVAFVPSGNNKDIFQLNINGLRFLLKYNEFNSDGTPVERTYELGIGDFGFYHIESDKAGTPISGINADNTDFQPSDNYRYLQYGTLMAIRADLEPFFDLVDTLLDRHMIINKAELRIAGVKNYGDDFPPPEFLQVYFTDSTTLEWPVVDNIGRLDTTQVGVNFIMLQTEGELRTIPPGAYFSPLSAVFEDDMYSINMSLFLQNLYTGNFHSETEPYLEEEGKVYIFGETDVLFPQKTDSHVFTNPMAIHKDSIRLRIHYTIPSLQN